MKVKIAQSCPTLRYSPWNSPGQNIGVGSHSLGRGVSLHGCSNKAQQLLLTLDGGYFLTTAVPDLQRGIAPLGPPAPAHPPLHGPQFDFLDCSIFPNSPALTLLLHPLTLSQYRLTLYFENLPSYFLISAGEKGQKEFLTFAF